MKRTLKFSYLTIIYGFFYLPLLILIAYSFNNTIFSTTWHGFTLKWYQQLFQDNDLFIIVLHSLIIALCAATFATILGTVSAIALYRYRFLGRQLLYGTVFTLIILPDIVLGIALLILFYFGNIPLGFWTLLLAHITFSLPFVIVTMLARLNILEKSLFEAAKDLGASEFTIFYKIMLPLLLPALIASWLLSFTLSIDDVIISFFVSGPTFQILPLYIFSMVKLGVKPEINALCSLILMITLCLIITAQFFSKKRV